MFAKKYEAPPFRNPGKARAIRICLVGLFVKPSLVMTGSK